MNLETKTYYPNENETIWIYSGKNIYRLNKEDYLKENDSVVHIPWEECYIGCIIFYKVVVFKEDSTGSENHVNYYRTDTILDKSENYFSVTWPNDSLLFH